MFYSPSLSRGSILLSSFPLLSIAFARLVSKRFLLVVSNGSLYGTVKEIISIIEYRWPNPASSVYYRGPEAGDSVFDFDLQTKLSIRYMLVLDGPQRV